MKIFGIAGHSGMGKTTLLERLIPEISSRGLVVSLIKHSHKNIDIDRPGKDSYRLRESGCKEVLLLGNDRWALMHELRGAPEPSLDHLLDRMQHCDLVLVEGFKNGNFPKLEVWRDSVGKETLWPDWPGIVAIASDNPPRAPEVVAVAPGLTYLDLADMTTIAEFVLLHAGQRMFGASSEQLSAQSRLFDEAESLAQTSTEVQNTAPIAPQQPVAASDPSATPSVKPGRGKQVALATGLPRVDVVHDVPEAQHCQRRLNIDPGRVAGF